jgi:hypothetical protein
MNVLKLKKLSKFYHADLRIKSENGFREAALAPNSDELNTGSRV